MAGQAKTHKLMERAPTTHRTVKFLTAATLGTTLLVLSCLILTLTVVSVVVATPLLVIFSPVLVPAGIVTFLVGAGFLLSGGFGVAALSAVVWVYRYVTGKHPPGAGKLDHARAALENKAWEMKSEAREYGHQVQITAQEGTTQAS